MVLIPKTKGDRHKIENGSSDGFFPQVSVEILSLCSVTSINSTWISFCLVWYFSKCKYVLDETALPDRWHVQHEMRVHHRFKRTGLSHSCVSRALEVLHYPEQAPFWFSKLSLKLLHFQKEVKGKQERPLNNKKVERPLTLDSGTNPTRASLLPRLDNKLSKTGRATSWP